MKSLFISTATAELVVAIIINEKIVYQQVKQSFQDMSKDIMPELDKAFLKTKLKPSDLNKIFVVNGPGSFTGIRIGLTVAKTMAFALNIPLVPISALEMLASSSNEETIALIDARRGYVYAGGYDVNLSNFMQDKYVLLEDLKEYKNFVSNDVLSFTVEKPKIDILKIIKKHINEEFNAHEVKPNYLKKTQAEENLNNK